MLKHNNKFIRFFLISMIICFAYPSCDMLQTDPVTVPAYIYVSNVSFHTINNINGDTLQGDSSFRFDDVWIFDGGVALGEIGFPALIPIQKSGLTEVAFDAGVLKSGQDDQRVIYPFTERQYFNRNLTTNKVDTFYPKFKYLSTTKFGFVEGFQSKNGFQFTYNKYPGDTILYVPVTDNTKKNIVLGATSGKIIMAPTSHSFEIESKTFNKNELQPSPGTSVYLELDYKSDVTIYIGLNTSYAQKNSFSVLQTNPTTSWNKVYVCLDEDISVLPDGTTLSIYIGVINNTGIAPNVFLDNIKLLHF